MIIQSGSPWYFFLNYFHTSFYYKYNMQNGNASLTQSCSMLPIISNAQNPLHTFPCNFPRTWGSHHVVADLLATYWHVKIVCHVASKSATSWQQVVVMEFGKQHYTTDTTNFCSRQLVPTCCGLATGKLWETGVMDFGLKKAIYMLHYNNWSCVIHSYTCSLPVNLH